MKYRYKVELETLREVADFVATVNSVPYEVNLTDRDRKYKISGKSMIGAIATVDWNDVWADSDSEELYNLIKKWVV